MILPQSFFSILLFATLSVTNILNTSAFSSRLGSVNLHLEPLPNPYPVPNTHIALNFFQHLSSLGAPDVIGCLRRAQGEFITHIRRFGDEVITGALYVTYKTVGIRIMRQGIPGPAFVYNDTFAVLEGIETKMRHEGYWEWEAMVLDTEGHGEVGSVWVYPSHN